MKKKFLNVSEMGKLGGTARAKNLTKEQRSNIARMGGLKRWGKSYPQVELDDKKEKV
jgi:general stress protein YciG